MNASEFRSLPRLLFPGDRRASLSFSGERTQSGPGRPLVDGLALLVSLVAVFAAAAAGIWLTNVSLATWYPGLVKPSFNPPNWIFGPVWSALYFAMAVAAWLVWRRRGAQAVGLALSLYAAQLILNVAWSGLFFALQSPGVAFGEVLLFWGAILATLVTFWRVDRLAGALFVPYLAWVSFAAVLNLAIWQLN
jgi:benzodiazapine receptor